MQLVPRRTPNRQGGTTLPPAFISENIYSAQYRISTNQVMERFSSLDVREKKFNNTDNQKNFFFSSEPRVNIYKKNCLIKLQYKVSGNSQY
jgi:hypothetical protein